MDQHTRVLQLSSISTPNHDTIYGLEGAVTAVRSNSLFIADAL